LVLEILVGSMPRKLGDVAPGVKRDYRFCMRVTIEYCVV